MPVETVEPHFTIRLTGEGVRPHLIPASDLAELLIAAEQTVLALAGKEHPEAAEDLVVGLTDVKDASIGFTFRGFLHNAPKGFNPGSGERQEVGGRRSM